MNHDSCRLCNAADIHVCLEFGRMPLNIQKLLREEDITADQPVSLSIYQCHQCGFVQLKPGLDSDYYDDYLMATSHSMQMQEYQRHQASDYVNRFNLVGQQVIEIGCGDG
ncbi:MAG: hypothetical protein KGI54_18005, partial [Pseudomonadota bacterium]|nr:hypothetical protein [Pseudomonadota bacterium]